MDLSQLVKKYPIFMKPEITVFTRDRHRLHREPDGFRPPPHALFLIVPPRYYFPM